MTYTNLSEFKQHLEQVVPQNEVKQDAETDDIEVGINQALMALREHREITIIREPQPFDERILHCGYISRHNDSGNPGLISRGQSRVRIKIVWRGFLPLPGFTNQPA